jgi:hypothetical protein
MPSPLFKPTPVELPYRLSNADLEVSIGHPGKAYQGTRFDHTGNIYQICFRKKHTFCVTEKTDYQKDKGFGLVNEFDIENPNGYEAAPVGGSFLKIGVGRLTKPDAADYSFFRNYPVEFAKCRTEQLSNTVIECESIADTESGFAVLLQKRISLLNVQISIEYTLKNIGSLPIVSTEYCHNFCGFDELPVSENYELATSFPIAAESFREWVDPENLMRITRGRVHWRATPSREFFFSRPV